MGSSPSTSGVPSTDGDGQACVRWGAAARVRGGPLVLTSVSVVPSEGSEESEVRATHLVRGSDYTVVLLVRGAPKHTGGVLGPARCGRWPATWARTRGRFGSWLLTGWYLSGLSLPGSCC